MIDMQPLTKLYIVPLLIFAIMFICTPVCAENVTITGTTVYTTLPTPAPGITTARPTIAPVTTIISLDYLNDEVYFGETVDLTKVISWSGKFAWWADGEYKAVPEQIVDVSTQGFYERYRKIGRAHV